MKNEVKVWLDYAEENLLAARLLLEQKLYNPCLQNMQQGIEKALKALLLEKAHSHRKTHSITELVHLLADQQIVINLSGEECDLLDSIYLPSKYPLGGVLPDFEPDADLCLRCVMLAEEVVLQVFKVIDH
ncbi:MAG: HEPN domain-containing protein [Desulfuromusa sp.]|nr:HEPN domain-containing protein [Desulfuromusa sp.]